MYIARLFATAVSKGLIDFFVKIISSIGLYVFRKVSRSALMVSASVVGMPCGKPL